MEYFQKSKTQLRSDFSDLINQQVDTSHALVTNQEGTLWLYDLFILWKSIQDEQA